MIWLLRRKAQRICNVVQTPAFLKIGRRYINTAEIVTVCDPSECFTETDGPVCDVVMKNGSFILKGDEVAQLREYLELHSSELRRK